MRKRCVKGVEAVRFVRGSSEFERDRGIVMVRVSLDNQVDELVRSHEGCDESGLHAFAVAVGAEKRCAEGSNLLRQEIRSAAARGCRWLWPGSASDNMSAGILHYPRLGGLRRSFGVAIRASRASRSLVRAELSATGRKTIMETVEYAGAGTSA